MVVLVIDMVAINRASKIVQNLPFIGAAKSNHPKCVCIEIMEKYAVFA